MAEGDAVGPRPRPPRFEVVVHGYNQRQVNERVTKLEFELNNANKARSAAQAQINELTELLAAARLERDQLSDSQVSNSKLSERVQAMMQLANEEIAELRRAADEQAKSTIEQADRQAAQQLAAQRRRAAELEAEHYSLVAELRADTERTKAELYEKSSAELEERRARLERTYAEAQETLKAEYDELRTALTKEHEKLMAEARTEATRIVRDANEHADKTRREIIEKADSRLAAAEARATELHELQELLTKRFAAAHEATQRAVESLALPHDFTADAEQTQPAKTQVREDQAGRTVPGQALPADEQTLSLTSKADGGQRRW